MERQIDSPKPVPPWARSRAASNPIEPLRDMGQMLRGNSSPGVGHFHDNLAALMRRRHADASVSGRVPRRVFQQVRKQAHQAVGMAQHKKPREGGKPK